MISFVAQGFGKSMLILSVANNGQSQSYQIPLINMYIERTFVSLRKNFVIWLNCFQTITPTESYICVPQYIHEQNAHSIFALNCNAMNQASHQEENDLKCSVNTHYGTQQPMAVIIAESTIKGKKTKHIKLERLQQNRSYE